MERRHTLKTKATYRAGKRKEGGITHIYGSLAQFSEIIKNSVFQSLLNELRPFIRLKWRPLDENW